MLLDGGGHGWAVGCLAGWSAGIADKWYNEGENW